MAKTVNTTIKFTGQFDTSQITKGLQDIKKQVTNANISEDLKKQFETAFNKLQVNIPALEKLTSKEDFNLKDIQALQKLLKDVTKDWENLNKVTNQIDLSKTFSAKDLEKINNLDKQIKQTQDNIQKARKELVDTFTNETKISVANKNVSDALTELFTVNPTEIDSKFQEIQNQFSQGVQQTQIELQNKLENANIQKTGKSVIDYFFGENSGVEFANKVGPVKDQINEIIRKYREFKEANNEAKMVEQIQKLNEVLTNTANFKFPEGYKLFGLPTQEDLNVLNEIGKVLGKVKELAEGKEVFFTEQETQLAEQFKQKLEAEAEAAKNANDNHQQFNNTLQQTGQIFQDTGEKVDDLADQFNKIKAQNEALSATFGGLAHRITSSISALTVFNKSIQVVHKAIASVKELDAAFTQIAIVSEQTNEQAWQMFDSFNKLAKQYSITTKDLTEGAKLFYQQGLSAADTMKMVEASTVSAALGEVTMTEAANTLTAAIQGYNESAAVAMDYTDKIAMVGAVSAADFNELSAAMEKTASSAYTAGLDFDNLLGYLGKMIEVTREAPANLGTAMKTIIARFEDLKKDPMAILEDGVSANKVEDALASIGVALRDTAGEFRPLQDVFLDLGMKWDSLSRNQQAYIATVAAGSRQQSRFLAIFNNFDRTLELITESQNSAGAAARQYATYQDSAAAATARLTAAWEEFYSKVVSSDMIKDAINALTKLVEVMSTIGPKWTAVIGIITAHSLNKAIKGNVLGKILDFFTAGVGDFGDNKKITFTLGNVFVKGLKEGLTRSPEEIAKSGIGPTIQKTIEAGTRQGIEKGLLNSANLGTKIGSAIGSALPVIGAITAALAVLIISYKIMGNIALKYTLAEEERLKVLAKQNKEIIDQKEKIKEQKDVLKDNLKIYEKYEDRIILTEEELLEQNNAVDKLKENNKKLIVTVDELGKKHIRNKEILQEQTKELKLQEKAANSIIARNKLEAVKTPFNKGKMQDTSVEQLINSGYTQEEAELLSKYGDEIQKYRNNDPKWYNAMFSNTPDQNLRNDILEVMRKNKVFNPKLMSLSSDLNLDNISRVLQSNNLEDIEAIISHLEEALTMSDSESTDNVLNFIIQKAKLARDGLELVQNQEQQFANSLAGMNLDFDNNILQNDVSNLINNIEAFGDGKLFEFDKDATEDDIEEVVNAQVDTWNEAIQHVDSSKVEKVHKFFQDLQDPNLSQTQREKLISDFRENYGDLYEAFEEIILHYQQGSDLEQKRRERLSNLLGMNLDDYNFKELSLIDRMVDNSDEKTVAKGLEEPWAKAYIQALSNFKQDVIDNPAIYGPIHDATIQMWQDTFGMKPEDAEALFEETYGTFPEIALQSAKEGFSKAKDLLDTDARGSLSDEDYNNLTNTYGEELNYYIKINNEGEKYLTLAGKISILEKERNKLAQAYLGKIEENNIKIKEARELIKKEGKENKEVKEAQEKRIAVIEKENELYGEQLKRLEDINALAKDAATATNISFAEQYYKDLDTIKQAEKEMLAMNGRINTSTRKAFLEMGTEYSQYIDKQKQGNDYIYTITTENLENIKNVRRKSYEGQIAEEKDLLQKHITALEAELEYFKAIAEGEVIVGESRVEGQKTISEEEYNNRVKDVDNTLLAYEEESENELTEQDQKQKQATQGVYNFANNYQNIMGTSIDNVGAKWNSLMNAMKNSSTYDETAGRKEIENNLKDVVTTLEETTKDIQENGEKLQDAEEEALKPPETPEDYQNHAKSQVERIQKAIDNMKGRLSELDTLAPDFEIPTGSGKEFEDELKKIADVVDNLNDALEDLDDLLKDVKRDLRDITIDYNPFTDLFEAWEAEWDYYYNIKNLIKQLETQSTYIDNIISADYTSAQEKLDAYDAKVGNITGKIAANDAYITTLRAGIAKQAKELESEFNQYYNVDNRMGGWQIFQRDTTLGDWEKTINEVKRYSYELSKLINTQENELNLLEANQEALEQERSAYESILSTVDSLIDSLGNNEDITVDLSGLEGIKVELQAAIDNESVENIKEQIRDLNDYIQELNIKLDLNDNVVEKGLEEGYERLKDEIDDLQDLIDTLNEKIAEQQELLQQLSEIYNMYVDTAIDTQQELYDAIVEQYQDEINEKKKHYDYLKQLDNDYLKAVKDNIDKERKAREDANKQQDFQKNLQRAQLLQQDTSGAYRNELANLNKEIENQRQDLYDDLVDKQVEALEKEIEKRHELYDLEVSAMEERLAYMQENAILLWEMVNDIVSRGSEEMMATLENTTDYINQNELAKERQRRQWELNTQTTYKGVIEGEIDMLQRRIDKAKEELDAYEELQDAIELSTATYSESQAILQQENAEFQQVMDDFMQVWTTMSSDLTGYNEDWKVTLSNIKTAMEKDIQALEAMGDEGGSIFLLNDKLKQLANKMYDEFIEERRRYKDSITATINNVEAEITAAINKAANKISNINPTINNQPNNNSAGSTGGAASGVSSGTSNGGSGIGGYKGYTVWVNIPNYNLTGRDYSYQEKASFTNATYEQLMENYNKLVDSIRRKYSANATFWGFTPFKTGGFANFTGPAWLDGTKSQPEAVLNAKQTKLFTSMVSSLERTAANNSNINSALGSSYNIGDINTNINVEKLDNETDIDRVARQVENRIMKSIRNRVVVSVA